MLRLFLMGCVFSGVVALPFSVLAQDAKVQEEKAVQEAGATDEKDAQGADEQADVEAGDGGEQAQQPQAQMPAQNQEQAALAAAQDDALKEKVSKVIKALTADEANHFFVMYTNYTIYSMVKAVRDDVGEAAKACTENNPKMGGDITARHDKWTEVVGGALESSYASIESLMLAQNYIPQGDIEEIFALVDATRAHNSSRFESVPVTTPEACQYMLEKMDETEGNMTAMLKATLQSYPNLLQKTQE